MGYDLRSGLLGHLFYITYLVLVQKISQSVGASAREADSM